MTSETRIAYGSRVFRQGKSRPCSSNQASSASSTAPTLQRQPDPDVGAAVGTQLRAGSPVVRAGDRLHDGEPEPTAVAGRRGPRERLERVVTEPRREAGPLVEHVQLRARVLLGRGDRDRATAVLERVVDEVPERLLH